MRLDAETERRRDLAEVIQETLDEAVCGINDLQEEFDENDSEIETVARECIAATVAYILESVSYTHLNLSYSPAKSKNYMLYCNGNFIGGLFDEELCFVYADSVSELLGQPEPVYHGYSSTAQHRMLVIPEEHWAKALKLLYAEKFDWSRLVYDITYTSIGAAVVCFELDSRAS